MHLSMLSEEQSILRGRFVTAQGHAFGPSERTRAPFSQRVWRARRDESNTAEVVQGSGNNPATTSKHPNQHDLFNEEAITSYITSGQRIRSGVGTIAGGTMGWPGTAKTR